jgi:gluconate 2-dehydrogenase gamma chain
MADQQPLSTLALQRRTFLKGTAGTAAFLLVHSAFDLDAVAAQTDLNPGLQYFNPDDAPTVEAIAERIWPTTDESPGARDAGVLFYIDRALAGPYISFQLMYRDGLKALDDVSQEQHQTRFSALTEEQQDALLTAIVEGEVVSSQAGGVQEGPQEGLEGAPAQPTLTRQVIAGINPSPEPGLEAFFNIIRTHTMEGLFADPIYGGNRDFAGWRAVGYPGAHYVYTEEEQQSFEPLNKPYQSIADL